MAADYEILPRPLQDFIPIQPARAFPLAAPTVIARSPRLRRGRLRDEAIQGRSTVHAALDCRAAKRRLAMTGQSFRRLVSRGIAVISTFPSDRVLPDRNRAIPDSVIAGLSARQRSATRRR